MRQWRQLLQNNTMHLEIYVIKVSHNCCCLMCYVNLKMHQSIFLAGHCLDPTGQIAELLKVLTGLCSKVEMGGKGERRERWKWEGKRREEEKGRRMRK